MRVSKKEGRIVLGRKETRTWEDSGPAGEDFRRMVRDLAYDVAKQRRASGIAYSKPGNACTICASARHGGWTADVVEAWS